MRKNHRHHYYGDIRRKMIFWNIFTGIVIFIVLLISGYGIWALFALRSLTRL